MNWKANIRSHPPLTIYRETDVTDENIETGEQAKLEGLSQQFMQALRLKEDGKIDKAEAALRDVIQQEPRLAEPHMELARLLLDSDRVGEAEDYAREALEQLEKSGTWTEDIPDNVVQALAHALLAEILRRRADEDDVIFGDPEVFKALVQESQAMFARAAELDDSDDYANYYAFYLGNLKG